MATTYSNFVPSEHMSFGSAPKPMESTPHRGTVQLKMPVVQLGDALMTSTWGAETWHEDNGKLPLKILVSGEVEAKIREMEAHVQSTFEQNRRAWFKKDKSSFTFKPMLETTDEGTAVKTKVVVRKGASTTKIMLKDANTNKVKPGTIASVNHGCEVLPYVGSSALWYNTQESTYGVALLAKMLVVKPGDGPPLMDFESMLAGAGFECE